MTREDVIKILEATKDFSGIAPEEFEDLDLSGLDFSGTNLSFEQADYMDWSKVELPLSLEIPKDFITDSWLLLLRCQPQFFDKCDKLGDFTTDNWRELLMNHPQFNDKAEEFENGFKALWEYEDEEDD